ncbi:MAG: PAS domain S-box protein [Armatimonadota bacterium]
MNEPSQPQCDRELQSRVEELERIVNQSPAVVFLWRAEANWPVEYVSDNIRQFGYTPEDFLSQRIHYADIVWPDDLDRVATEVTKRTEEGRPSSTQEYRIVTESGEIRWVDDRTWVRRDENGIITHFQGVILDITEQKLVEEELAAYRSRLEELVELRTTELTQANRRLIEEQELTSAILNTSGALVIALDQAGRIVRFNRAAEETTGYSASEVLGKLLWGLLVVPEEADKARAVFEKLRARRIPSQFQDHLLTKDGTRRLITWSNTTLTNPDGSIKYVIGTGIDITDREQEEERQRSFERRVEAQKRQFYRETILSVTDAKLDICEAPSIRPYITEAEIKLDILGPSDVADARRQVEHICHENGLLGDRLDMFVIGAGEAITNAVKHADGGRVYAGAGETSVWVAVADKGKGIESLILPRATLLRGFSTKPSLGLGYSIMLEVSDHILLKTGSRGTTVVLVKNLNEPDEKMSSKMLPDMWENTAGG